MPLASGVLASDRPGQPQEDAYNAVPVRVSDVSHKRMYEGATAAQLLPLALHHVIPWNRLRDFWNEMQAHGYWKSMATYGSMLGVAQATMTQFTNEMRHSRFGNPCELDGRICWAQWNLVRGPQYRSDDPGDQPDNLRSTYGNSENNDRIGHLLGYGEQMGRFVANMPSETVVRSLVTTMKGVLNRQRIMEFDAPIWRISSDSPAFVRGGVDAPATHPTWCIRGPIT